MDEKVVQLSLQTYRHAKENHPCPSRGSRKSPETYKQYIKWKKWVFCFFKGAVWGKKKVMLDLIQIDLDLRVCTNDLFVLGKNRKAAELDTEKRIAFAVCWSSQESAE